MYIKYIHLCKYIYIDFNVETTNYMAEPTVWSPHVIKAFPHVMCILANWMLEFDWCWLRWITGDKKVMNLIQLQLVLLGMRMGTQVTGQGTSEVRWTYIIVGGS